MTTSTWQVIGMTCEHCARSVTEELLEVAGVRSVDVVVDSGEVTVDSDGPLDREDVVSAVEEAGYQVA